jgi:multidrug efflux pump subunit AcrB
VWIVRYALKHPYTIGAFAILILLVGALSLWRISTDILPSVRLPSLNIVWYYSGLRADDMAAKITSFSESSLMNNLDDVKEVRAETTDGVGIITVEFQPNVNLEMALAQVSATQQTILKRMPRGTQPPSIIRVDPSSTPILNLVVSSDTLNDGELYDYARLQLRSQLKSIAGLRLTLPYGGAPRQIMVELDPARLQAHTLSASDVEAAIGAQNLALPTGVLREGRHAWRVTLNSSPENGEAFEAMPIRTVEGRTVLLRDVATVRDGPTVQTHQARLDGRNAVIISVIKMGNASTVDVVRRIRARLPELQSSAPDGVRVEALFDQSVFVATAAQTVVFEVLLVACLVAGVVLLFIGSLRSTLIVLTSIPLALLCAIIGLYALGHTLNLMSLGGLALSIGLLVDNALVEIENSNRRIEAGEPVRTAILNSAREVVFPEFLSTLCICIVFIPIFMMSGVPSFIFKPLALSVVLAMAASFVLSRTLIPTLAAMLLPAEQPLHAARARGAAPRGGAFGRLQQRFDLRLARWRDAHEQRLRRLDAGGIRVLLVCMGVALCGALGAWLLGREFFPRTDAGMIRFYLRAQPGLRLEETDRLFAEVQHEIRATIPERDLALVSQIVGQPDPINLAWVNSSSVGSFDGEVLVQLKPGHAPTAGYQAALRQRLGKRFPGTTLFFQPADSTNLTLAGASPTDIDIRIAGKDSTGNRAAVQTLIERMRQMPGLADVSLRQVFDQPELYIEVDRMRALELGITQEDAADAVLSALGNGGSVAPTYWADANAGTSYVVQILAPPLLLDSVDALLNLPVRVSDDGRLVTLRVIAHITQRSSAATVSRVMQAPALDVLANVQGVDLGSAVDALTPLLDEVRGGLKAGNRIELVGMPQVMDQAYRDLAGGLVMAIVLVFLVQVVNFQSWLLPLNALAGLPLALAGCVLALKLTGTALSVPALMGIIMVVGVSTANSVLVISFARDRLADGMSAREAARAAARARFRPVLMTATAMIVGVIPMAIGHGAGAEQNAPLGRAVIGGLLFGTGATLTVVPLLFGRIARRRAPDELAEPPATVAAP